MGKGFEGGGGWRQRRERGEEDGSKGGGEKVEWKVGEGGRKG